MESAPMAKVTVTAMRAPTSAIGNTLRRDCLVIAPCKRTLFTGARLNSSDLVVTRETIHTAGSVMKYSARDRVGRKKAMLGNTKAARPSRSNRITNAHNRQR